MDVHKRVMQKYELTFAEPLDKVEEAKKARVLQGLEITTTWKNNADNLNIAPVMAALEVYKKTPNTDDHIFARYQLPCLQQDDRPRDEYVTVACLFIKDNGYDPAAKEDTQWSMRAKIFI